MWSLSLQSFGGCPTYLQGALKWFLIAPQAFLREPRRGGKKGQSSSAISARFDSIVRDDWGTVLALLQADRAALKQRDRERGRRRNGDLQMMRIVVMPS